jgi:adenylate cyclase
MFKHPLTQEVAYTSQLTERRRNTHAAAARAVVELYPDKQDEQAALLAHHSEEAGEALEAARWHARAAGWVRAGDPAQSVRHWQRVHELIEPLPETDDSASLHLLACLQILQFGWRLGLSQTEVDGLYAEGQALAARRGDARAVAYLANAYSTSVGTAGNAKAYLKHAIEAARLAEECGDLEVRCLAQTGLLYSHWAVGRLMEARHFADRGLELVGEDRTMGIHTVGFSVLVFLLTLRGLLRALMGELEGGRHDLERGVELAREINDSENLGWGLGLSVGYAFLSGEPGKARAQALESLEIAEKLGSALSLAMAYHALGEAQLVHEEWREAIDPLERALEIARRRGTGLELEALVLAHLARAYLGADQMDRARTTAEEGVRVARRRGSQHLEVAARLSRARVLLASDGAKARPAIEKELARALELMEETGGKAYEPQILVERAELARLLGDDAAQELELNEAHRLFVEMGAVGHAQRVAAQLKSLSGRS